MDVKASFPKREQHEAARHECRLTAGFTLIFGMWIVGFQKFASAHCRTFLNVIRLTWKQLVVDVMIPYLNLKSGLSGWTDKGNLETMDLLSSEVRFCFLMSRGGGALQCWKGGRQSMVTSYHQDNVRPQFC
jgi:hypothetical protein